ncbi:hypothetical protein [Clostridium sp.]|uniref:hypothetical protein n=1 Tax=Clostridium sp. TaxID=1506 RepID=UPI0029159272|nr:hypothetical protein [Clostridium sp.]MDU5105099.1 hypothetical protein [Clostridium sp.]
MRKSKLLLSLIVISSLFLISCTKDKAIKPDSPVNTSILIKSYIDAGNYEDFKNLFSEGLENSITEEDFNKLKDISTPGSSHNLYEIIAFENGEMLLIKLYQIEATGEYKVEEVLKVPDEFKTIFNYK